MRLSQLLVPTLRDAPKDAEVVSHQLMMRAGLIRKLGNGIFSLLPLGLRSIRKFSDIVRQEMEGIGAQEVLLPAVIPQNFGNKADVGKNMVKSCFALKIGMTMSIVLALLTKK